LAKAGPEINSRLAAQQGGRMSKSRDDVTRALKQAEAAARRGELSAAERWSKTADRLAAVAARMEAMAAPQDVEDDEAARAELRRRLERFAEADSSLAAWEAERELYEANFFAAIANGTEPPPPLRPRPGAPLSKEDYLASLISAPYP
jgi:hypothetical protein